MDYYNTPMREAIDECVHNELHRLILRLRLLDGWTYDRIAADPRVDRTARQVHNILSKYTPRLHDYLLHKTS